MATIQIQDEHVVRRLQEIAKQEDRPLEEILREFVDRYSSETPPTPPREDRQESIRRVRSKAYAKARAYWSSVGDRDKAALTDAELDVQFGAFDEEGVPRLRSELASEEPPAGSLAYAAKVARDARLDSGQPDLARRSSEVLNEHFADDLLQRGKNGDGAK